ncbi:MAG: hypothetical protein QXK18_05150 [Candidatus Bathyarchaeia archaeon]
MSYRRKSWQEKLADKKGLPKVLKLEKSFPCYNAVHKMGADVGDAEKHKVKACCSLTTGIFIMIAANAAEEAARQGKDLGIPYWRTLKANGFLNEKYPGGAEAHKELLEKEGFKIMRIGKKYAVQNYQDFLMREG